MRKGDPLLVGEIRYSTPRKNERKRYWTEIVVSDVIFPRARPKVLTAGRGWLRLVRGLISVPQKGRLAYPVD